MEHSAPSFRLMSEQQNEPVHIVGGGLAGSEAAWQLATRGVPVILHEMRPVRATAAHKSASLAELVCSNSFRSDDREHNAIGLLHEEMRRLGSLIMRAADANQVPAGGDGRCGTRSEGQPGPPGQPHTRKFHGRGAAIGGRRE